MYAKEDTRITVMKSGRKFSSTVYASGIFLIQIQQRRIFSSCMPINPMNVKGTLLI